MPNDQQPRVNFQEIKERVSFVHLFHFLELPQLLEHGGEEITTTCPLCQRPGFTVNFTTNKFSCRSCKERGSVIDFVSAHRSLSLRESGLFLNQLLKQLPSQEQRTKSPAQPQNPPADTKAPASNPELQELLSMLREQTGKLQTLIETAENIFAKLSTPSARRTAKGG